MSVAEDLKSALTFSTLVAMAKEQGTTSGFDVRAIDLEH